MPIFSPSFAALARRQPFAACCLTLSTLAGSVALAPIRAAHADVKVVQEQTLTGLEELGARGIPTTNLTFYKGDKFREELQGRSLVFIYDCGKDRYYILNRSDKTYSVQTLDEAISGGNKKLAAFKFQGVAAISEGGSTRTIAGKSASNYTVQTAVRLTDEKSGLALLTVKLEGDQWTTKAIPFPSSCPKIARIAYLFAPRAGRLLQSYLDKTSEMKGLPLSYDYIVSLSGAINGTFEAHADVKSVTVAPLPDYLFKVPASYRLVDKVVEED